MSETLQIMDRQRVQPQLGKFSVGINNDPNSDFISITFNIPKIINVPCIGRTSIEAIGLATATCGVPWLFWFGRRKAREIHQYIKDRKDEYTKPDSPIKAKRYESKGGGKLDDFMDEVRANRKHLRKVEDPDTVDKRKEKRDRTKMEQAKKPKGQLGLSDELLQNSRSGLRQSADAPLSSYLDENRDPRVIDANVQILREHLEQDRKVQNQVADGEHVEVESSKCIIS